MNTVFVVTVHDIIGLSLLAVLVVIALGLEIHIWWRNRK